MLCGGIHLYAKTSRKSYLKRFSGVEKFHRNSIRITVELWRRARDSNPRTGVNPLHDFQSCSFDQLGQLSKQRKLLYTIYKKKSSLYLKKFRKYQNFFRKSSILLNIGSKSMSEQPSSFIITSAYFLHGSTYFSCIGLTVSRY